MYHVPHHAWHPSRAGNISNGKDSCFGCSSVALGNTIFVIAILIMICQSCGSHSSTYGNADSPNSRNMQNYTYTANSDTTNAYIDSSENLSDNNSSNNINQESSSNENNYITSSSDDTNTYLNSSSSYNYSSYSTTSAYTNNNGKTEYVNGYYRKDGTYVHSYHRRPKR